jgi:hypothetical protein
MVIATLLVIHLSMLGFTIFVCKLASEFEGLNDVLGTIGGVFLKLK